MVTYCWCWFKYSLCTKKNKRTTTSTNVASPRCTAYLLQKIQRCWPFWQRQCKIQYISSDLQMVHIRIFFWILDRVVHACWIVATWVTSDDFFPEWEIYKSKHDGRKKFQVHLGIALMNKGIQMDWKYPFEEKKKPAWMPKTGTKAKYYPCDCKKCVFCINKKTSSTIAHGKVTAIFTLTNWQHMFCCLSECCKVVAKKVIGGMNRLRQLADFHYAEMFTSHWHSPVHSFPFLYAYVHILAGVRHFAQCLNIFAKWTAASYISLFTPFRYETGTHLN